MKFNFLNLALGVVLGIASFFGIEFFNGSAITPSYVHIIVIPFFVLVTLLPSFRKKLKTHTGKTTFILASFVFFSVGFFIPFLVWAFIVIQALSNAIG